MISWLKPVYGFYERLLEKRIKKNELPHHIAIIMDGNRRFCENVNYFGLNGHEIGARTLENVLEWCWDIGIKIVTVYGFSTENFRRKKEEVDKLMKLFEKKFIEYANHPKVHERQVRLRVLGKIDLFPENVRKAIIFAEERTKNYDRFLFNVALGYGGRQEMIKAIKSIASDYKAGKIKIDDIDEKLVSSYLYTSGLPDPDLIIRTSGEERLSGFLLWQSAYSELYFCETYWPAFRKIDLLRAIRTYQQRQRRFGL